MTSWRAIVVLAVLAIVSTGLAGWAWMQTRAPLKVDGQGELLLPGLAEQARRVARIELRQGKKLFVLRRLADGRWVGGEAAWPVPAAQVRSVLVTLMEMKKAQPATALAERFRAIHVDDPNPDSLAARLTLKDTAGKVLADVILGKEMADWLGDGRLGQFVRLAGARRAWLVEGHVRASTRLVDWAETSLLKLPDDAVAEVVVRRADGGEIRLLGNGKAAPKDGTAGDAWAKLPLRLADAPPGAKPHVPTVQRLHYALTDLEFEKVRKAGFIGADERPVARTILRTRDGLELELETFRRKGDDDDAGWWLRGRVLKPGKDAKLAEKLRQRLQGRVFKVYDSVGQALSARLSDVIEAKVERLDMPAPPSGGATPGNGE